MNGFRHFDLPLSVRLPGVLDSVTMANGDLQPHETELRGSFLREGCRTRGDTVCARIEWLRSERLERIAVSATGWDSLFRDPRDGRLWELRTENGPPTLRLFDPATAKGKYPSAL